MPLHIPIADYSLYATLFAGALATAFSPYLIVSSKWHVLQREQVVKLLSVLTASQGRFRVFILLKSTANVCNG